LLSFSIGAIAAGSTLVGGGALAGEETVKKPRIAVATWAKMSASFMELVKGSEEVSVEPIDKLDEKIYDYDVLVMAGMTTPTPDQLARAYDYLNRGFGVLVTDEACGFLNYPYDHSLFPEVEESIGKAALIGCRVKESGHPIFQGVPEYFSHGSWDHVVMSAGPQGKALAVDSDGNASIVAGQIGSGRLVALGWYPGPKDQGVVQLRAPANFEKKVVLNSLLWLAQAGPKNRDNVGKVDPAIVEKLNKRFADKAQDYALKYDFYFPMLTDLDVLGFDIDDEVKGEDEKAALKKSLAELKGNLQKELSTFSERVQRQPGKEVGSEIAKAQSAFKVSFDALRAKIPPYNPKAHVPPLLGPLGKEEIGRLRSDLKSETPEVRIRAAKTLGLRDCSEAAPDLCRALKREADPLAQRYLIYAVGWLKAKDAVPQLLEMTNGKDKWLRRRAVQALGMIGDARAGDRLIRLLADEDVVVRENALYALGWLKENKAVEPIMEFVKAGAPDVGFWFGRLRLLSAALSSLGMIGDERAVPFLLDICRRFPDMKDDERRIYAQAGADVTWSLGLLAGKVDAKQGIEAIGKFGDRFNCGFHRFVPTAKERLETGKPVFASREPGMIQPLPDIVDDFNDRQHRVMSFHNAGMPQDSKTLLRYSSRMGATDIWKGPGFLPGQSPDMSEYHMANGLRWMTQIITEWTVESSPQRKPGLNRLIYETGSRRGMSGYAWEEEDWFLVDEERDISDASFRKYLAAKYSAAELAALGVNVEQAKFTTKDERFKNPVLWAESVESVSRQFRDELKENAQWLYALRRGDAYVSMTGMASLRNGFLLDSYHAAAEGTPELTIGAEPWNGGTPEAAFACDYFRDGTDRAVAEYIIPINGTEAERYEVDLSIAFAHAQVPVTMWIGQYFYDAVKFGYPHQWVPGRWGMTERVFKKMKDTEEYLVKAGTAGAIGQIFSSRTSAVLYRENSSVADAHPEKYYENQLGVYVALMQSHLPFDLIQAETMTAKKIERYGVLILSDAKALTAGEAELLRQWVAGGGMLVATGTTSLYDQWGRKTKNYALSDVFGLDYAGSNVETPPEQLWMHVYRETKPASGIGKLTVTEADPVLGGMKAGDAAEYDLEIGYDKVTPRQAKTVAKWENGDPAILVNDSGKGKAVFLTAAYPGLSYCSRGWMLRKRSPYHVFYDFWPGARELLANVATGALRATGKELPLRVENCPVTTEVVLRSQPQKDGRSIVHLVNYDPLGNPSVKGVKVRVAVPGKGKLKASYAPDGKNVAFKMDGNDAVFTVRPFRIHEMIVLAADK